MAKKIPRTKVISFRLTDEQYDALEAEFKRVPCRGVKSAQRLARKFVIDAAEGRMVYKLSADRERDTTTILAESSPKPRAKAKAKRSKRATADA
jgi:hypothetical protein